MGRAIARWLLPWAVLAFGCGSGTELAGVLDDLRTVGEEVRKATGHQPVTVKVINERHLSIGMVNSRFASLPADVRRVSARSIAEVGYESYRSKSRKSLETVTVCFVVHRRYLLLFSYTNATDCQRFRPAELEAEAPSAAQPHGENASGR